MSEHKPNVSESEARAVAEGARETTWEAPSFVRELFLGRLDLGLIHPWPEPDADEQERAAGFLEKLERFLDELDTARMARQGGLATANELRADTLGLPPHPDSEARIQAIPLQPALLCRGRLTARRAGHQGIDNHREGKRQGPDRLHADARNNKDRDYTQQNA